MDGNERFARRPGKELAMGRRHMAELAMEQTRRKFARSEQAGFTLVELMIACIVLVVGLLALSGLIAIGVLNNNRNKVDTTATMLAQSVIEHVDASLSSSSITHLKDCSGNAPTEVTVSAGGATVKSDGKIDFSEAPPAGYSMVFQVCSTDPASGSVSRTAYDVRWNVTAIPSTQTLIVTAAAVAAGTPTPNKDLRAFAFPSNLRVMLGPEPSPSGPGAAE
jgi:Tfp pilus assembly protein PilV